MRKSSHTTPDGSGAERTATDDARRIRTPLLHQLRHASILASRRIMCSGAEGATRPAAPAKCRAATLWRSWNLARYRQGFRTLDRPHAYGSNRGPCFSDQRPVPSQVFDGEDHLEVARRSRTHSDRGFSHPKPVQPCPQEIGACLDTADFGNTVRARDGSWTHDAIQGQLDQNSREYRARRIRDRHGDGPQQAREQQRREWHRVPLVA